MISLPSSSQLLEAIRRELRENVRTASTDPAASASLDMVDSLLASIAIRCDHEIAWMREEIAEAEGTAEAVLKSGADHNGKVAEALDKLRANRSVSDHTPDVQREYNLGGMLLSLCLEAALPVGGALRTQAEAALENRLAHELKIRGEFSLTGRT